MGRTTKIVLIVAAGLLVLCLCSAVAGTGLYIIQGRATARHINVEVSGDSAVSSDATGYTLPDGYRQDFNIDAGGLVMIGLRSSSGNGHIYLLQAPGYLHIERAELERRMRESIRDRMGEDQMRLREVGTQQVIIRGEQVQMNVSEGTSSRGEPYRQMLGLYDDPGGTMLLLIAGPLDEWDQGAIDSFLASIR